MSKWKMVKLEVVAEVVRGITFGSSDSQDNPFESCVPIIRAGNIQDGRLILDNDLVYVANSFVRDHQIIRKDDIIMCTSSGSASLVGKCAMAPVDWHGSYGAFNAGIRPNEKAIPSYLYFFLNSSAFKNWTGISSGANIKNIRNSELKDFPIPLPPIPEQQRIVEQLDQAQKLIDHRKEQLKLMDDLIQSTFYDMFGDPVKNEKGWEVKKLGDVCYRVTDGTHQSPNWSETGYPFLFVSNIRNHSIDFNTSKFVSLEEIERLTKNCPIEVGDILYTVVGSYGFPVRISELKYFAFQRHIAHIKPKQNLINTIYFIPVQNTEN